MLEVERAFSEGERAGIRVEALPEGGNLRAGLWSREAAQGAL